MLHDRGKGERESSGGKRNRSPRAFRGMRVYEATIRDPGPGGNERKVRIGAESPEEARKKLQELYGPRSVPYMPRLVPA